MPSPLELDFSIHDHAPRQAASKPSASRTRRGIIRRAAAYDSTQRRLSRFLALRGPAGVGMRGGTPPVESECVFVTVRAGVSCGVGYFGAPLWGRWFHGDVSGSVVRPRKWCAHARDAW